MDLVVQRARGASPIRSGYQRYPPGVVVRRGALGGLPLGQYDERRSVHVEGWVHRRRALLPPRERQPHVRAVPHAVRGKDAEYGVGDLGSGVHVREPERLRRTDQSVQVSIQVEYSAIVNPDPL